MKEVFTRSEAILKMIDKEDKKVDSVVVFQIERIVWFENMIAERKRVLFVIPIGLVSIKKEGEVGNTEGIITGEARMAYLKGLLCANHGNTVSCRDIHRDNIHIVGHHALFGYIPIGNHSRSNTEKYIIKRLHCSPSAIREFYSRTNP